MVTTSSTSWTRRDRGRGVIRRLGALVAAASLLGTAVPGPAAPGGETHALLIWLGNYGDPGLDLPGAAQDAARAREIARRMGAAPRRIVELRETDVTQLGIQHVLDVLERRVGPDDRVFVYFSGHGRQIDGRRFGTTCSEGIVTHDGALFLDIAIRYSLERLAARSSGVIMMNDSCHAGGAASKSFGAAADAEVAKSYPGEIVKVIGSDSSARAAGSAACGQVTNKALGPETLSARGADDPPRWVHLGAAQIDEAAFSSPRGSRATRGWLACLTDPALRADADGDGWISADELRACAQPLVDAMGQQRQRLATDGNGRLPVAPSPVRR